MNRHFYGKAHGVKPGKLYANFRGAFTNDVIYETQDTQIIDGQLILLSVLAKHGTKDA